MTSKKWKQGLVDQNKQHFKMLHGDLLADEELLPVALVAETDVHNEFVVEFLQIPNEDIQQNLKHDLNFFLNEKGEEQTFSYMIYHASNTASNLYGMIHWQYIEEQRNPYI